MGALFLDCVFVYPFVDGRVLSAQGELTKQILLLLFLALMLVTLYSTVLFWASWRILRDLENGRE